MPKFKLKIKTMISHGNNKYLYTWVFPSLKEFLLPGILRYENALLEGFNDTNINVKRGIIENRIVISKYFHILNNRDALKKNFKTARSYSNSPIRCCVFHKHPLRTLLL